jgi:hypothetical protein
MCKAGRAGLWVGSVLLVLAGCAAPPPRTTVNVISDKFSPGVTLEGLPKEDVFDSNDVFWMLRSVVYPQTRSADHEVYVEWFFPGHGSAKYFAADDTARPLPVRKILKENCGAKCGQTDTVGIGIDEATLRGRATTGFQVKLSATDGSSDVLDITPQMISAQLAAEGNVLGSEPPNPPTSPRTVALGVSYPAVSASKINPAFPDGLLITAVTPQSPAEQAGIHIGDVLISFDGTPLIDPTTARVTRFTLKAGSIVKVEIQRDNKRMKLDVQF